MKTRTPQHGFTLIELMVAMVLIGLIVSALYGAWRGTVGAWTDIAPAQRRHEESYRLLEQITGQLRCSYLPQDQAASNTNSKEAESYFLARPAGQEPLLRFITTRSLRFGETPRYGLVQAEYRLDFAAGRLLYRELPWPDVFERKDTDWLVLSKNIVSLELIFAKEDKTQNHWNAEKDGGLPELIKVNLMPDTTQQNVTALQGWVRPVCTVGEQP